jgi:hypothetical protein
MFAAVLIMLTAIVGALSALDSPAEAPLALDPDAMQRERAVLTFTLHSRPASPVAFCRTVPIPRLGETAFSSSGG